MRQLLLSYFCYISNVFTITIFFPCSFFVVVFCLVLANLSRRLIGELIVYPFSGVRRCHRSQFSNLFSSETAWPIKAKFNVEPPWEGGTKVCINGPGHMTKMAAMPIYGKNLKKIFSSRTAEPISTKLDM